MKNSLKILDCTFRDGGYYNKWDFDTTLVKKYLNGIIDSNIDLVELGFRNFPQDEFFGAFAYTTDSYIDSLNINKNILVGIMINASSILDRLNSVRDSIRVLFKPRNSSRVDLVRIAIHFDEVEACEEIVQELKVLGYQVGINLMQSDDKSDNELLRVSRLIQSWKATDILYFADSLGCMDRADVRRISSALKSGWKGDLGFHAHNNRGLAVSNSLVALESGIKWIDCTILGMGRGAGNAQTENLVMELVRKYQVDYQPSPLYELSLFDFSKLQEKYHWGECFLYGLAAINHIHPTYIQEMLSDNRYSHKEILRSVKFMSQIGARRYDQNLLLQAREYKNKGTWNAGSWCIGRSVLILGSGKSLENYEEGVIEYIKQYRPIVISLDVNQDLLKDMVDIYVSSNESKMLNEF